MDNKPMVGKILWHDLTVPHAEELRDFYANVIGWEPAPHDCGDYYDFNMLAPGTENIEAGICHARGSNANVPPQWLMYVQVADVELACRHAVHLGGSVVDGPRLMGGTNFAVIRDPAGAVLAVVGK
jgi:predicted enzyme related to lactoylglutathione lyase